MDLVRLRQARKKSDLTIGQVAKKLGVSANLPGQWERGEKRVPSDQIKELANIYKVSTSWLLGEEVEQPREPVYYVACSPNEVLVDPTAPLGLKDLASDTELTKSLNIQSDEWRALRSIRPPKPLGALGYVAILLVFRQA